MKKFALVALIAVLAPAFLFAGCGKDDNTEYTIIGTWISAHLSTGNVMTYVFDVSGKFEMVQYMDLQEIADIGLITEEQLAWALAHDDPDEVLTFLNLSDFFDEIELDGTVAKVTMTGTWRANKTEVTINIPYLEVEEDRTTYTISKDGQTLTIGRYTVLTRVDVGGV